MVCSKCCESLICYSENISLATKYTVAKWFYLCGFIITSVLTWILRDYANHWFENNTASFALCRDSAYAGVCGGQEVAIRISFANFCYFALHAVVLMFIKQEEDPRTQLHGSFWLWKALLWSGVLVGFFFVPSQALFGYAQVARIGSGIFLVLQLVLLIHFLYEVNEWLVSKEERWSWALLVLGAFVAFTLGLLLIGLSYYYFAPSGDCSMNMFFITWSIIIMLALIGVLFIPNKAQTAGLMTSGAVFLYCSFLLYSALNSEPSGSQCIRGEGGSSSWIQIVAFFIGLATVIYSALSAGLSGGDMMGHGHGMDEKEGEIPYRADFFHVVFALASMYIAMLFTDWQVSSSSTSYELDNGWISTWVKMVSKWVCELLYLWTVVAPALFPNRDFSYTA
ncbi:hypothetical protein CEUSTIGMA_g12406.t1 [Chlamydomonas eustigma]|uniref:Serine incorporator n=1 Tax=Chlamydomonas eustigma TaxID=1157962 RepID=A0A250XPI8_9CHLO|nr:hypothetical protein CEUSTIGMA_g12406.t1 [Chlamydomonas eustigma]|eukprot:GAX84985.1 hypothetical protein CEUSTIGMA_g12406.t1 [Chlamydomonas eustigma]